MIVIMRVYLDVLVLKFGILDLLFGMVCIGVN